MWSCDTCGRPNRANPLICDTCGAAAPGAKPEEVALALQRDLAMESHLRALGFWYRVGAVLVAASMLTLVGVAGRFLFSLGDALGGPGRFMAGTFGWLAMFIVAVAAGCYVLGHFLGRFVNGARIAAAVLTLVSLVAGVARFAITCVMLSRLADAYGDAYYARPSLLGPIALFILSTLWSIAMAWTLLSGRAAAVCAPTYRTIVARTSSLRASLVKSPFFVVPLVVTLMMAMLALRLMLALHTVGY